MQWKHTFPISIVLLFVIAPSSGQTLQFSDQTGAAGISAIHAIPADAPYPPMVGGGVVGDFDNDGWQDILVLMGGVEADRLYMNNGDGTFTDRATDWGIAVAHQGAGASVGDYNNDGWLDIYITSYGPQAPAPGNHRLYRNNGDGTFTDVATQAGVNMTTATIADGFGSAFGDYDLDGDLDLAVACWANGMGGNRLFRNNGDGTFTNVTASVLQYDMTPVQGFSPRFTDMNNDRYPELLFVADHEGSKYFRNDRDGTFTEMSGPANVSHELSGMGTTTGDFNNDGIVDWFVTAVYDGIDPATRGNMLYINIAGNHRYYEISESANVSDGAWGWGAVAADFNHDGLLDLGETNGWNSPWTNRMNRLWINNGDDTFDELANTTGFNFAGQGRGLVNFDYDGDGDQDMLVFANQESIRLFRNDLSGTDTNWIRVFLDTNADPVLAPNGFGSRVIVTAGGQKQYRYIDGGCNYLSVSELSAHFGVGSAATVDVRVEWSDGSITVLDRKSVV